MKLKNSLALRHLRANSRQALSAFLAIALATSMLTAVSSFCFSVYDSYIKFAEANGLMDSVRYSLNNLTTVGVFMGFIIVAAAIFVISNSFHIQVSERIRNFGILKSVGATESQIKATVMAEGNWLSIIAIPIGIIFGHLLCFAAILVLKGYTGGSAEGETAMDYRVRFHIAAVLLAAALSYVSVYFAVLQTAQKASKLSAIEAIRQNDEIKITAKKQRTSRLAAGLFGFEGTLAAKQIIRNKRKFFVTVLSLVVSVVMFISAFSFGDTLLKTALGAYANTGANVVSEVSGNASGFSEFDDYAEMLKSHNPKGMQVLYSYHHAPDNYFDDWYQIITMNDEDYKAYCKRAGVKQGSNILLKGFVVDVPFHALLPELGNESIFVTEETELTNPYLKSQTMSSHPTIIIPKNEAQRLNIPIEAHYFINTENAADFIAAIKPICDSFGFDSAYHHNTDEYTRDLQQMYAMMMMFVYCFIGMLTLIGATSALATINSNINLRKSEFAILRAVGMETKRLHRMLNLESALYGVKSLVYGLPIGLIFSYFMHKLSISQNMRLDPSDAAKFSYEIPYAAILICIFGVFAINFVSMHFATDKIRRSNIAETMRELNC